MADPREIIRAGALAGVAHGFFTGIGPGNRPYHGPPDPALLVPGAQLVLVRQVHSPVALSVTAPFAEADRPDADALVTAVPGLVLGVVTADCAPVLFADRAAGVIGAAHAGWRGAHFGVLDATVQRMEELGATRANIAAAIGPTIEQASYEVGKDLVEQFGERHQRFFTSSTPGKWQFDLPAYVGWRLASLGLGTIETLALDTYADEKRFHSYRRATHRGEPTYGRQFSLIGLP